MRVSSLGGLRRAELRRDRTGWCSGGLGTPRLRCKICWWRGGCLCRRLRWCRGGRVRRRLGWSRGRCLRHRLRCRRGGCLRNRFWRWRCGRLWFGGGWRRPAGRRHLELNRRGNLQRHQHDWLAITYQNHTRTDQRGVRCQRQEERATDPRPGARRPPSRRGIEQWINAEGRHRQAAAVARDRGRTAGQKRRRAPAGRRGPAGRRRCGRRPGR